MRVLTDACGVKSLGAFCGCGCGGERWGCGACHIVFLFVFPLQRLSSAIVRVGILCFLHVGRERSGREMEPGMHVRAAANLLCSSSSSFVLLTCSVDAVVAWR